MEELLLQFAVLEVRRCAQFEQCGGNSCAGPHVCAAHCSMLSQSDIQRICDPAGVLSQPLQVTVLLNSDICQRPTAHPPMLRLAAPVQVC